MRKLLPLAFVALLGCGGGGGAPLGDPLDGTAWGYDWTNGQYCGNIMAFNDGEYTSALACLLTSGNLGIQVDEGPYTTNGDALSLFPTRASCNWTRGGVFSLQWNINSGGSLVLQDDSGFIAYEAIPPGGGQAAGTYGCFDDQLAFTPMPVHDL